MHTDLIDELYRATARPRLVRVPTMSFLAIDGQGDPRTGSKFSEAAQALFTVTYAMRSAIRRAYGVTEHVNRLESLWWADDMADFSTGDRSSWHWTAMIRQPDLVTKELFRSVQVALETTRPCARVDDVRRTEMHEGPAAQVLHVGPFSTEAATIARLHRFINDQGLAFDGHQHKHHEIYLSDPRRTAPERLRTIIRQPFWPRRSKAMTDLTATSHPATRTG